MPRFSLILLLFLLAKPVGAEEPTLGPQPGVLLLRNGSIIEGQIIKTGDRYEVRIKDGDLRVRVSEVEFFGRTLHECYEHRSQSISFGQVNDHLSLAEWCLRHHLRAEAARELGHALACDPKHPKIGVLERRLRMTFEESASRESAEPVRLNAASTEDLDRMVRSMPPGTVETFTNVIQPMLLNQCSTAGCHGPASTSALRLMRVAANRTQSRRATQRNLHSVLGIVDTDKPDNSPLLTAPIRAHGTSRAPVFTSRQTLQYQQLVAWAFAVAGREREEGATENAASNADWPVAESSKGNERKPKSLKPRTESPTIAAKYLQGKEVEASSAVLPVEDTFPTIKPASATEAIDPRNAEEPSGSTTPGRLGRRLRPGQNSTRSTPRRGELPGKNEPADPFDAEQFNRRYLGGS